MSDKEKEIQENGKSKFKIVLQYEGRKNNIHEKKAGKRLYQVNVKKDLLIVNLIYDVISFQK